MLEAELSDSPTS